MKTPCVTLITCLAGLAVLGPFQVNATEILASKVFKDAACAGTPAIVVLDPSASCADHTLDTCAVSEESGVMFSCADSYIDFAAEEFDESPYVLVQMYKEDSDCGTMLGGIAFLADSECRSVQSGEMNLKAVPNANGTVAYSTYNDSACAQSTQDLVQFTSDQINTDICVEGHLKLFAGNTPTTSSTTSVRMAPMLAQIGLLLTGFMMAVL